MQGASVRSLVRELRSHMPHGVAKKRNTEQKSLHKCVSPTHDGEFRQQKSTINKDSNLFLYLIKELLASILTIMT